MACREDIMWWVSVALMLSGVAYLLKQRRSQTPYGRYMDISQPSLMVPAKMGWFIQELPSFLVPVLLVASAPDAPTVGRNLLLGTFCLHYFQRTFVYSLLNKGRPWPFYIMLSALVFCSANGFFQGYNLLYCAKYDESWLWDIRLVAGLILFFLGLAINIHSDHILRNLRKPGEVTYRIPRGGMFDYVSGANFFGEILEWFGYAIATWSMPTLAFAIFSMCSIGPRAYHHHRYYIQNFKDYPRSRKSLIPFIF